MDDRTESGRTVSAVAAAAGLVVAVFLLYARVGTHGFVALDDADYVTGNPLVRQGLSWEGLRFAFSTFHAQNWHPLTWLSHMLDCELFGVDPGAHHRVNVALHAANAALLFVVLRFMTRSFWRPLAVAALFAFHPLRVESVAWVAERKDVLSALFGLSALGAYGAYARRPGPLRYAAVVAALALGLLSKPMLVTLPLVLLLLDLWPLGRSEPLGRRLLEKAPLFALAAACSVLTLLAQQRGGAVQTFERVPFVSRLANAGVAYAGYLWKTLWPAHLAVFYPHPATVGLGGRAALAATAIAAALFLVLVTVLVARQVARRPYLAVGWLWYLGMLVPVIGIVQVGGQALADRYSYLPSIGIYLAVVWGAAELLDLRPRGRILAAAAVAVVLVPLAVRTWSQIATWRDSEALFAHAVRVTRDNYLAHVNLGTALERRERFAEAEAQFRRALEIRPDYAAANYNLGLMLQRRGDLEQAAVYLERSIREQPDDAEGHLNLGVVLAARGDLASALTHYEEAIRLKPGLALAHLNAGTARARLGDLDGAIPLFEEALRLDPRSAAAHQNLGATYELKGDLARGVVHYEQAAALAPDDPAARERLRRARARLEH